MAIVREKIKIATILMCRFEFSEELTQFLQDLEWNLNKISNIEKNGILECFPFSGNLEETDINLNPNYLTVKLLRKIEINPKKLQEKLNITPKLAEEILKNPLLETKFPIVNYDQGVLNSLLVIPLSEKKVIIPDKKFLPPEVVEGIQKVLQKTSTGFLVTFKYIPFKGQSFTMALYAVVNYKKSFTNLAFTGILTEKGNFEAVEFLDKKLEIARKEGIPLIYSEKGICENTHDLKQVLTNLEIPFSILLKEDRVKEFESFLKFKENYIREVFHIKNRLHFVVDDEKLPENKTTFEKIEKWLDDTINELKEKIFSIKDLVGVKVATSHYLLAPAFMCGLKLSKASIPVSFYGYDKALRTYKKIYTIGDDKFDNLIEVEKFFKIKQPIEVEDILISTKTQINNSAKTLVLKSKYEKLPEDETIKGLAQGLASLLRELSKNRHYRLKIEIPTALAFALGYYLEDYLQLSVYHKTLVAFEIGYKGKFYLTDNFDIAIFPQEEIQVNFKPLSLDELKDILNSKKIIPHITSEIASRILQELVGKKYSLNSFSLKLNKGDSVIIIQIPPELKESCCEKWREGLKKISFWKLEIVG